MLPPPPCLLRRISMRDWVSWSPSCAVLTAIISSEASAREPTTTPWLKAESFWSYHYLPTSLMWDKHSLSSLISILISITHSILWWDTWKFVCQSLSFLCTLTIFSLKQNSCTHSYVTHSIYLCKKKIIFSIDKKYCLFSYIYIRNDIFWKYLWIIYNYVNL